MHIFWTHLLKDLQYIHDETLIKTLKQKTVFCLDELSVEPVVPTWKAANKRTTEAEGAAKVMLIQVKYIKNIMFSNWIQSSEFGASVKQLTR